MSENVLKINHLTMQFGGVVAVNDLSMEINRGEIVALIGPNGAGKTTAFNCVTGVYEPTNGEILFEGKPIARNHPTGRMRKLYAGTMGDAFRGRIIRNTPDQITRRGIARTFQSIRLFGKLPVLENVLAGRHCRMKAGLFACMLHTPGQRREEKAAVARCMEELRFVGLADRRAEAAGGLSYGNQRLLEIARALASDPRLLILDEPAGGMNDQETAALVDIIGAIRERGITVLLIEHDMRLVMRICEKLVVLEHGTLIAEGAPMRRHPAVIEAYLGADDEKW